MPTQEEVIKFFECISKAPLKNQLMCMLAFVGGLRREEITVGATKTFNSERTISLPPSVMKLRESYNAEIKALAMRRAKRNNVVLLDDPINNDKWLFSQPDGSIGHPHTLSSFLKNLLLNISYLTLHRTY